MLAGSWSVSFNLKSNVGIYNPPPSINAAENIDSFETGSKHGGTWSYWHISVIYFLFVDHVVVQLERNKRALNVLRFHYSLSKELNFFGFNEKPKKFSFTIRSKNWKPYCLLVNNKWTQMTRGKQQNLINRKLFAFKCRINPRALQYE